MTHRGVLSVPPFNPRCSKIMLFQCRLECTAPSDQARGYSTCSYARLSSCCTTSSYTVRHTRFSFPWRDTVSSLLHRSTSIFERHSTTCSSSERFSVFVRLTLSCLPFSGYRTLCDIFVGQSIKCVADGAC